MSVLDNALQALFAMAHKETLWENASPESNFKKQTIPLTALTAYDAVIIQLGNSTSVPETTSHQIFVKTKTGYAVTWSNLQAQTYLYVRSRTVEVNAANIVFGDCYAHAANSQSATVQNGFAVPQIIYGLKLSGGGNELVDIFANLLSYLERRCA